MQLYTAARIAAAAAAATPPQPRLQFISSRSLIESLSCFASLLCSAWDELTRGSDVSGPAAATRVVAGRGDVAGSTYLE